MGFSRQEYWSGLPCPPPGDLPNPGIKPRSPTLQADSLLSQPPEKLKNTGVGSLSLLLKCLFSLKELRHVLNFPEPQEAGIFPSFHIHKTGKVWWMNQPGQSVPWISERWWSCLPDHDLGPSETGHQKKFKADSEKHHSLTSTQDCTNHTKLCTQNVSGRAGLPLPLPFWAWTRPQPQQSLSPKLWVLPCWGRGPRNKAGDWFSRAAKPGLKQSLSP